MVDCDIFRVHARVYINTWTGSLLLSQLYNPRLASISDISHGDDRFCFAFVGTSHGSLGYPMVPLHLCRRCNDFIHSRLSYAPTIQACRISTRGVTWNKWLASWFRLDIRSRKLNVSRFPRRLRSICSHVPRYAYVGTDGAYHIAEEMEHPGRRLPQIMNLTMLIGLLSALPLFVALMYEIDDPEAVASSALPSLELFHQATGSKAAAIFMQSIVSVVYVCE